MQYENISGFKYRLIKTISIATPMRPAKTIKGSFATLTTNGRLYLKKGLLWDGASGAIDTKSVMLPSAAHDIGCSWYLKGLIDDVMRRDFDDLFKLLLDVEVKKGNISRARVGYMYKAVKLNTKLRYGI